MPVTRDARPRRYLMCPPTYFTVAYEINPWMHQDVPTDTELAVRQWEELKKTYDELGHEVELIEPIPGLPDMVYAANGAVMGDGVVYSAKFTYPQRQPEGPAYEKWFADAGFPTVTATEINEGEGDILTVGELVFAGTGFRTSLASHLELQEAIGKPVISMHLVDPRFYHLDTAMMVLSDDDIAYYPEAFSDGSRRVLERLFPDALIATEADAEVLGLNGVSDGKNVIHNPRATALAAALAERGYNPIGIDTSELLKGGGGAKCCTLEIRA
ncbi:dimethylargininase [Georgenia faecalis]|uniref:Dimethylargininase n=1 Tax=Georgenia faecalis TaxID=2483799 RepID=A0ABV9D7H6_9MICO|nr:dimethylargininase [Georgenia faecalis]